jgi:hypothetical protein
MLFSLDPAYWFHIQMQQIAPRQEKNWSGNDFTRILPFPIDHFWASPTVFAAPSWNFEGVWDWRFTVSGTLAGLSSPKIG